MLSPWSVCTYVHAHDFFLLCFKSCSLWNLVIVTSDACAISSCFSLVPISFYWPGCLVVCACVPASFVILFTMIPSGVCMCVCACVRVRFPAFVILFTMMLNGCARACLIPGALWSPLGHTPPTNIGALPWTLVLFEKWWVDITHLYSGLVTMYLLGTFSRTRPSGL